MKTSTPTPTPRPALKATGMRRRHARCLETELAALTAERDQLRAELAAEREKVTMLLSDAYALTKNWHDRAERAEAELATERARLDSGQILLTVAGERVWCSGVDLRAAIDAKMKEDAK